MQLKGPTKGGLMYSDTGGNEPVAVLLHGVLMNGTLWAEVVRSLSGSYRCIVPELPFGGHSRPMPRDADLTLESMSHLLARFLEELDLREVTLVSNDWGGAQLVIWPGGSDRVANLVLVSCEAFDNYPPGLPGRLLRFAGLLPGGILMCVRLLRWQWIRNLPFAFGNMTRKPIPNELFMAWLDPALRSRSVRRDLAKYLRSVPNKKELLAWAERQRSFRGQVLVIWAREDRLMPPEHARRLAAHFRRTRLIWVDDSRTLIPVDQPATLADHIESFGRGSRATATRRR